MKKTQRILLFLSGLVSFLLNTTIVSAQAPPSTPICPGGQYNSLCNIDLGNGAIVGATVSWLMVAAVVLSLIFIVWGALKWIRSGGDRGKVDAARSTIIAAIVGVIIAMSVYFLVSLVFYFFTRGNLHNMTIPRLVP
jgi:hypothetical protein